jgi:hypothetical protein
MEKFIVLRNNLIDPMKWDEAVIRNQGLPYQLFEYLNASSLNGWNGIIFGDYLKVFPFFSNKKFGIPYVYMPQSIQQFSNQCFTELEWNAILKFLQKNYVKITLRHSHFQNAFSKAKQNYVIIKNHTESQTLQYSSLLKRNLKKASTLTIESKNIELEDFDFIFSQKYYQNTIKKDVFFNFYTKLNTNLKLYQAFYHGALVAQLLTVRMLNREILLMPISNEIGRNTQAMSGLINEVVQNSDAKIIDFEGSSIASIAHFYKQFGAKEITYFETNYWSLIGLKF